MKRNVSGAPYLHRRRRPEADDLAVRVRDDLRERRGRRRRRRHLVLDRRTSREAGERGERLLLRGQRRRLAAGRDGRVDRIRSDRCQKHDGKPLENYNAILENYNAILKNYNAILKNYNTFSEKHNAILENYNAIFENYNAILKNYNAILTLFSQCVGCRS